MPDLIGRRLYTSAMVGRMWGFAPDELEKRVAAGDLPEPLKRDRFDADAIDRIYWERWYRRCEATIAAIKPKSAQLPPTPALVGEYFRRRRSTLSNFTEVDLEANERLWRQTCEELVETAEKPVGAGRGGVTHEAADVRQPPIPVTHQEGVIAFPLPNGTRECATCRKAFKPYRKEVAFCSGRCRQKAYRERKSALAEAAE
jgi:hypothetical protein